MDKKEIKQFISYFFVGGVAALVEWISFYTCDKVFNINYLIGTSIAFVIATYVNYVLGKKYTFKNNFHKKKNAMLVYLVSAIGLGLNILLMYLFVNVIGIIKIVSKIISTGIVFFWNYISRKVFIYKKKEEI